MLVEIILWSKVPTDSNDTVSIQVNRSVSNYEDVYIEVYDTNSTMKPYNSKSLSNWTDGSTIITVQNISLIVIKAKRLNLNSNYSVTVSQPSPNKKSGFPLIAFLLLLIFGMIAILAWAGWLVIIILHWLHKRKIRYIDDDKNKRNEEIIKALSSMKSGKLGNFTARFDEPKCVICLENFDKNSDVHIINECFHYFHTNWLQNWFKNIRLSMKLKWPLCQSIITHNSKLIHNNLVTDRSQNREVLEEYSSQIGLR